MRRDYFTIDTAIDRADESGAPPALVVRYDGPVDALTARLRDDGGTPLGAGDVDVAYRRQGDGDAGVLAITERLTGEFVLEVDTDAGTIESFVDAAREEGGETSYRVRIVPTEMEPVTYDKRTFLVYDDAGNLDRENSLIPSGVEL